MPARLSPGYRVVLCLATNPGFENKKQLGELFKLLGILPGVALQRRINENCKSYPIKKHYEKIRGCVRRVFLWITVKDAARILLAHAAKERKAAA